MGRTQYKQIRQKPVDDTCFQSRIKGAIGNLYNTYGRFQRKWYTACSAI